MVVAKHTVVNFVRDPKDRPSLKVRRKRANLNQDDRGALTRQTRPLT